MPEPGVNFDQTFLALWFSDPEIAGLSIEAAYCWITMAGRCSQMRREYLSGTEDQIACQLRFPVPQLRRMVSELSRAELVRHDRNSRGTVTLTLLRGSPAEIARIKEREKRRQQRLRLEYPDTEEEVLTEAESQGYCMSRMEAAKFLAEYRATGWMRGGTAVRDWKALLGIWRAAQSPEQRRRAVEEHRNPGTVPAPVPVQQSPASDPVAEELRRYIASDRAAMEHHVSRPIMDVKAALREMDEARAAREAARQQQRPPVPSPSAPSDTTEVPR